MDIFNVIFLILLITGFCIIITALIFINKEDSKNEKTDDAQEYINKIKSTIDQADLTIDDLNLLSERIFKAFDEKQKELLFLYDMADKNGNKKEYKSDIDIKIGNNLYCEPNIEFESEKSIEQKPKMQKNKNQNNFKIHPKFEDIKMLLSTGMDIAQISKKLGLGQGEVKFILGLGKDFL